MSQSPNSQVYFLETRIVTTRLFGAKYMMAVGRIIENLEKIDGEYYYLLIETSPKFTTWRIGIRSETNKLGTQEKRVGRLRHKKLSLTFTDLIPPLIYEPTKIFSTTHSDTKDNLWGYGNENFAGVIQNDIRETWLVINPRVSESERILRGVLHRN